MSDENRLRVRVEGYLDLTQQEVQAVEDGVRDALAEDPERDEKNERHEGRSQIIQDRFGHTGFELECWELS